MSFQPLDYLRHILVEVDFLLDEARKTTEQQYLADGTLRRAFIRSFEVIGKAAKKVAEELRTRHPEVRWK